jgi:1-acyl-sn-glycerol-3-phosphate acyltransferase
VLLLKPPLLLISGREWRNGTHIPAAGGCVIVANHVSQIDPVMLAHFIYDHGRVPRALAKDSIFRVRGIGSILRSAGQIPVSRDRDPAAALATAVAAAQAGACLLVYPEGSITKDPDGWPMRGKTGAARIALLAGVPVIPVGQWGAQEIQPAYTRRLRVLPRRAAGFSVGEPVDLSDLAGREIEADVLAEATERIMTAITAEVASLRGIPAPCAR